MDAWPQSMRLVPAVLTAVVFLELGKRLVVELVYLLYAYSFVEQLYLVVTCGSLCLSMCAIDAARSCVWNPGPFIAIRAKSCSRVSYPLFLCAAFIASV
eukprot:scaffold2833_cov28-Attheya_sp.AAC.1